MLSVGVFYFPQISQIITNIKNQCPSVLSVGGMLFIVAVLIVNADEGTAEGQYLAEGY